jgi:hypothetical protein
MAQSQHLSRIRELAADSAAYSLQGIADRVGLSKQRVHQIVQQYNIVRSPRVLCLYGHPWAEHRYTAPNGWSYCRVCNQNATRRRRRRQRRERG